MDLQHRARQLASHLTNFYDSVGGFLCTATKVSDAETESNTIYLSSK